MTKPKRTKEYESLFLGVRPLKVPRVLAGKSGNPTTAVQHELGRSLFKALQHAGCMVPVWDSLTEASQGKLIRAAESFLHAASGEGEGK